jgi:protein subunit release factor A
MLRSVTPAFQSRNNMNLEDLKIETYPIIPEGGQKVNYHSRGVKITHIPSELVAICTIERSQTKNRDVAIAMIEAGLEKINWNHHAI